MAPRRGRRPDEPDPAHRALFAAGRMVGFVLFAGLAMAILAAVVLLPAYARSARADYRLACARARVVDAERLVAARERLIAEMPHSGVLTESLAMSLFGLRPSSHVVVLDPAAPPPPPPGTIHLVRAERPDPPSGWLMGMAERLGRPNIRRGLLLMAAASLILAMFLFSPPGAYAKR